VGETGSVDRPHAVRERAPAKLTLSLRVTGVRGDGYHLIEAEMITVDLFDDLDFVPNSEGLEVVGPAANGVPASGDNLVSRALRLVGRRAAVRLHKRIPTGAGLGGVSADAAAVLRWAGCADAALALRLGADVPFCLRGGHAVVRGVGDVVERLPAEDRTFTLLLPPSVVPTAAVYRAWDELGGPRGDNGNDLEPAALAVRPELAKWRAALADATGTRPRLAGSGGTWFVEGAFPGEDRVVVRTVE
jgi:4-diphosphocytidyl-2-C-methyl-D-erythritol kinase